MGASCSGRFSARLLALNQLERSLSEEGGDLDRTLEEVISATPFWSPLQAHRLKSIKRNFNTLADAAYNAADDIAALVRCRNDTSAMGDAVVQSASAKREFNSQLIDAGPAREKFDILRNELARQKQALTSSSG